MNILFLVLCAPIKGLWFLVTVLNGREVRREGPYDLDSAAALRLEKIAKIRP